MQAQPNGDSAVTLTLEPSTSDDRVLETARRHYMMLLRAELELLPAWHPLGYHYHAQLRRLDAQDES